MSIGGIRFGCMRNNAFAAKPVQKHASAPQAIPSIPTFAASNPIQAAAPTITPGAQQHSPRLNFLA